MPCSLGNYQTDCLQNNNSKKSLSQVGFYRIKQIKSSHKHKQNSVASVFFVQ